MPVDRCSELIPVHGLTGDGTSPVGNPVWIGGHDGTNLQSLLTDPLGNLKVIGPAGDGASPIGNPLWIGGFDGTNIQGILTDVAGRLLSVGAAGDGASPVGNPLWMAGFDGTLLRALRTDTSGRLLLCGPTINGQSPIGNPSWVAGWDGTNLRALLTDTTGRLLPGALPAGTANIGDVDVLTLPGGLRGYAEDAPHASGDIGALPLAVFKPFGPEALVDNPDDYHPFQVDGDGALYVRYTNTVAAADGISRIYGFHYGEPVPGISAAVVDGEAPLAMTEYLGLHVSLRRPTGEEAGTATEPLRINPTGTTAQPVTDNGGSLTVDGTIAVSNFPATQPVSGTVAATQSTSPWVVGDGGGSLTVDGAVSLAAAVPAGTNNIGDVDVLTLPAATVAGASSLPAGTNNIGDVDVLTLPALPTGTNTIGNVGGQQAHNAAPVGNPLVIGGVVPSENKAFRLELRKQDTLNSESQGYILPTAIYAWDYDGGLSTSALMYTGSLDGVFSNARRFMCSSEILCTDGSRFYSVRQANTADNTAGTGVPAAGNVVYSVPDTKWFRWAGNSRGEGRVVEYTPVVVSGTLTRPANTTTYTINDELTDTGGAILAIAGCARYNGGSGYIEAITVIGSVNAATDPLLDIFVFDTTSTPAADNAAFAPTDAVMNTCIVAKSLGTAFAGDVATGGNLLWQLSGLRIPYTCGASSTSLFVRFAMRNGYVPPSNSEIFVVRLHCFQS